MLRSRSISLPTAQVAIYSCPEEKADPSLCSGWYEGDSGWHEGGVQDDGEGFVLLEQVC